jgi:hypothetical protein
MTFYRKTDDRLESGAEMRDRISNSSVWLKRTQPVELSTSFSRRRFSFIAVVAPSTPMGIDFQRQ